MPRARGEPRTLVGHELLWRSLPMCIWRYLELNVKLYKKCFAGFFDDQAE